MERSSGPFGCSERGIGDVPVPGSARGFFQAGSATGEPLRGSRNMADGKLNQASGERINAWRR
ncbi:MAG: hypothetical protein IT266_10405 [Saprospiraceae bacterium]|nr:hypothetical protein [Saprospiraceae bacterium]